MAGEYGAQASHEDEILALAVLSRGQWVLFATFPLAPKQDPDRYLQFQELGAATSRARALAGRRKIRLQTDAQVEERRMALYVRCADLDSDGETTPNDESDVPADA